MAVIVVPRSRLVRTARCSAPRAARVSGAAASKCNVAAANVFLNSFAFVAISIEDAREDVRVKENYLA